MARPTPAFAWSQTLLSLCMQKDVEEFLFPEPRMLAESLRTSMSPHFTALNRAMGTLLEEYSLVSFVPLDVTDEDRCAMF